MVSLPNSLSKFPFTDQDIDKDSHSEKVTLMTVHAAKDWSSRPCILWNGRTVIPSPYAESPRELEEERRLFDVAITRAEENCIISHAKSRFRNGQMNFC